MSKVSVNCLICGDELLKTVKSNFSQYYICKNCKTSQLNPFPSSQELSIFYDKYHLASEQGGSYDWVEERMQKDFPSKIELIQKSVRNIQVRLLDVGCGKGFFVAECLKKNIDATGIDISASGIDYAINELNLKAEQTDIYSFSKRSENQNKFDVITLWATVEHLANPSEVFSSISNCLKPGGLFFLDTGLGNDKFEKFLSGHSQWYDAPQHLFVYSVEGLAKLLSNAGFDILIVDKNFERNSLRRIIKFIRHLIICISSFILLYPILGKTGFNSMQCESKWPIGKLIQVIASKRK